MLREIEKEECNEDDLCQPLDDGIHCAQCGDLVTRGRWRLVMNEGHEHTVFNPHGNVFRVLCFKEAPGVCGSGASTDEFTWFKGYAWTLNFCEGCGIHLGWRYEGATLPRVFFGLIRPRLTLPD